jgi:DNA-binding CsgD family transcriptional regulator
MIGGWCDAAHPNFLGVAAGVAERNMPVMNGRPARVERDAIRGVERVCSAGLDSVSFRREVLRRMAPSLPADAYFFNILDPETGLITNALGEGAPFSLGRDFLGCVYPEGEAERVIDLARSGEIVARQVSGAMRDLVRQNGFCRELRAAFSVSSEPWGLLCAIRQNGAREFDDRERNFVKRVAAPVARGLRHAALRDAAVAHEDGVTPPGIVVIDERGRIEHRTAAATAQLADLADVGSVARELPSVIRGLLARQRQAETRGVAWLGELRVRGHSGRWYSLRTSLTEPDESGRCSSIVMIAPVGRAEMANLLARLYGLSPRERQLVTLVARGYSTKQIAAQLGISAYTVQDHLDNASAKVGVRGRRALLAKLFFDCCAPRLFGRPT